MTPPRRISSPPRVACARSRPDTGVRTRRSRQEREGEEEHEGEGEEKGTEEMEGEGEESTTISCVCESSLRSVFLLHVCDTRQ